MSIFGRLQIYLPDSPVENFILLREVAAIGRSTGNDLILDRNGISRYHAKLTVEDQQALLTDLESVNGVYVDGVRIEANEPRVLRGGEEIQLADVRLIYYPPEGLQDTLPSFSADTTQHFQMDQLAVYVTGPDIAVVPGSHVQALIVIDNLSEETNRYLISVEGVPADWVRLERSEIELEGNDQVRIMASFKPLRRSESRPGNYPLTFNVRPKTNRDTVASVQSTLTVGTFSGYGAMMGTSLIEGKQPFRMHLHNQGNDALTLNFRGTDAQKQLKFNIDPPRVTLAAGERRSLYGTVSPKNRTLFGALRQYRYDIIARAEDASGFQAPVSGLYVARPLLPSWAATLALPVVAVVVVAIVALLLSVLGGEDPIVPVITSFSVVEDEIILGDPVTLEWDVQDAAMITLEYARPNLPPQVVTLTQPGAASPYQLMLQTSGVYTVTLRVENTGGRESDIAVVRVLPAILNFQSEPNTLTSHISQEIELSWSVAGADVVDGDTSVVLESPQLSAIQGAELPEQGSRSFTVRPVEAVSVTLRVTGRDGTENSSTLALAVEPPRCTLSNPSANVYSGPGLAYEELAVIEDEAFVVNPVARNVENTWLQVNYEGGLAWVRVAAFACEGFTTNQLDPEVDIPLPPPSPTPTNTFTPSPSATATASPTATATVTPSQTPSDTPRPTRTPRPSRTPTPSDG